jgi:MYXO-CTERM domain-containing protein
MRFLSLVLLAGCGSSWLAEDLDGDGWSVAEGDCYDVAGGESGGIASEDIHPGNSNEVWYDGVDQNCDGLSDYDKDGDGHPSVGHDGTDCWDDPASIPADFVALTGFYQPLAREVNPDATEVWYDDVDQDCSGGSDHDQDGDGHEAAASGGDDCNDLDATKVTPEDCGIGGDDTGTTDTGSDNPPPDDTGKDGGVDASGNCGCASETGAAGAALPALLAAAVLIRRRRSAAHS